MTELCLTNVAFLGHVENVEDVWAKHNALLLPSRFEGMPLVVVEAMLCGRPCIATDVGGNSELIQERCPPMVVEGPRRRLRARACRSSQWRKGLSDVRAY